jgi:hypothetical protein
MATHTTKVGWRSEFFAAVGTTLGDSRLWLIILPSLVVCGLALSFMNSWLAGVVSIAVALIDAHLINRIESLPRPDGKELATGLYRAILFPAAIGTFVISGSDLPASIWFTPWHWFHNSGDIRPCSYLMSGFVIGILGVAIAAALTALLTRERAVFATIVGLTINIPVVLTESFSNDDLTKSLSIVNKSCKLDLDDDIASGSYSDGFGFGIVAGILTRILIAIFVAKLVSTWLARRNAPSP